jgi:hypothetical protein
MSDMPPTQSRSTINAIRIAHRLAICHNLRHVGVNVGRLQTQLDRPLRSEDIERGYCHELERWSVGASLEKKTIL